MPRQRNTSELDTLLQNRLRLRSEQMFQQQLHDLREATRRQLQEAERRQRDELERRIQQNALLSTFTEPESSDQRQLDCQTKDEYVRTSAQTSDKGISHKLRQSERAKSPPAWVSSKNLDCCSVPMSRTAQLEEEAEAECQKKFCALPVPNHVSLPRYQEMMELREKERKQGLERRKNFLLSTQKPFSFHEREKEKREKLSATLKQASQDQKAEAVTVGKRLQNVAKLPPGSELKDQDLGRKVDTHIEALETLRKTAVQHENRADSGSSKPHTAAERTKREMLGFLDKKPNFQPKILQRVPDFSKLHKAFQTAALFKSTEKKDETKCRPFYLRTSALPARQRRLSPEPSQQEPKVSNHFSRSRSLGVLTSLSADTLPTYITDAARKRSMAIRKSMELRESKDQESADWMRKQQMRSQAMKKMIAIHAKLLDPRSSLKEQYNEKLQHHREADQRRSRDYRRELRDMKARVSERPFLFEQVKQRTAKAQAEQMYRNKLKNAGLNERFVEANGEAVEGASSSSRSDDDTDGNDRSAENDIQSREENADDGEKIEDVEEKSVKSKREEMP